jgi:hypothetical protein
LNDDQVTTEKVQKDNSGKLRGCIANPTFFLGLVGSHTRSFNSWFIVIKKGRVISERSLMAKGKVSYDFQKYRNLRALKNAKPEIREALGIKAESLDPLKLCTAVQDYIKRECAPVRAAILNMRMNGCRAYSTEELISRLQSSSTDDWKDSPAYFSATAEVIKNRIESLLK